MNISLKTMKVLRLVIACRGHGHSYDLYRQACYLQGVIPMPADAYADEPELMQIALDSYQLMHATILKAQQSSKSCN